MNIFIQQTMSPKSETQKLDSTMKTNEQEYQNYNPQKIRFSVNSIYSLGNLSVESWKNVPILTVEHEGELNRL